MASYLTVTTNNYITDSFQTIIPEALYVIVGRKEMIYLITHSTHFIYGYIMVNDHSVIEETHCHHMGYSFRLAARVLLYASFHRQDNTYHSLCYTSRGALTGTRNSSMGWPWRIDPTTNCTMSKCS